MPMIYKKPLKLTVQRNTKKQPDIPSDTTFEKWMIAALPKTDAPTYITLRLVTAQESAALNSMYRLRPGPTNVLAFSNPDYAPPKHNELGDLVICAPLIAQEAAKLKKNIKTHWARLCVHGTLHLLGYDHTDDDDAIVMEAQEKSILAQLGFSDPTLEDAL